MSAPLSPRGRRPLGANVSGYSAALIVHQLGESLERSIRAHHGAGRLELARDLAVTLADLREAAAQYRAATGNGSTEAGHAGPSAVSEPLGPPSGFHSEVDSHEAAAALGLTSSRVRQLLRAGELSGRQDRTGRWSVDVDDLHRLEAERSIP